MKRGEKNSDDSQKSGLMLPDHSNHL